MDVFLPSIIFPTNSQDSQEFMASQLPDRDIMKELKIQKNFKSKEKKVIICMNTRRKTLEY